jgi:hypothetical protein
LVRVPDFFRPTYFVSQVSTHPATVTRGGVVNSKVVAVEVEVELPGSLASAALRKPALEEQ